MGNRIINGSSGQWGDFEMPPNKNISREESMAIAGFILKQGSRSDQWIYSGLEGVFQIKEKPEEYEQRNYILTAGSVNQNGLHGEHPIMLLVK